MGHTEAMSSTNGLDPAIELEIYRLADEGYSSREISKRTGVPRSTVKRRVDARRDLGLKFADDDDDSDLDAAELARLEALDSGQPVVPPITCVGVATTITEVKGWDAPQVGRELRYLDAEGHSLSTLDVYRYGQALEQAGRWTEAEELTAELDRQHAEDPELILVTDLLGTNPHYEPRESDAVDARWTLGLSS